jgi:hypothetical protein
LGNPPPGGGSAEDSLQDIRKMKSACRRFGWVRVDLTW